MRRRGPLFDWCTAIASMTMIPAPPWRSGRSARGCLVDDAVLARQARDHRGQDDAVRQRHRADAQRGRRAAHVRGLHQRSPDDELLDLRRAFVDAEGADAAVEALDVGPAHHAQAAVELHRGSMTRWAASVAYILAIATSVLPRALRVLRPAARATSRRAASSSVGHVGEGACTSCISASACRTGRACCHVRERLVERPLPHPDGCRSHARAEDVERPEREAEPWPHLAEELRVGAREDEPSERVMVESCRWLERTPARRPRPGTR